MSDKSDAASITKADLRAAIDAAVEHLERRIDARHDHLETRLDSGVEDMKARIERTETALLTEFHKWASPIEMRLRSHSAALRALDMQQESLADDVRTAMERLAALERKAEGRQPPNANQ